MTPNASKQGKFGSFGRHIFVHIFALYVGGWGFQKSPHFRSLNVSVRAIRIRIRERTETRDSNRAI